MGIVIKKSPAGRTFSLFSVCCHYRSISEFPTEGAFSRLEKASPRKNPETIPIIMLNVIVKKRLCVASLKRIRTLAVVAMFSKAKIRPTTVKQIKSMK